VDCRDLDLAGLKLLTPRIFRDSRGSFSETYNKASLVAVGIAVDFVQDNQSLSHSIGVLRGLHFQVLPRSQGKLVRVNRGAILDVAVDLRTSSPTYGRHVAVELSAENRRQLWVPSGFAHGFCTLAPDTEVIYKVTDFYSPESERGVAWNDPTLGISWPIAAGDLILADRDRQYPRLADLPSYF
jgi:dTDP-4-dehydrorhamnose 3,5-epimerase